MSPNGDRLLFTEKLADNTHQIGLLEARTEQVTILSSPGCDVDATSLGWFNDTFVGFSMKCPGDQYFQARLVNTYNLNDSTIPPITQQMGEKQVPLKHDILSVCSPTRRLRGRVATHALKFGSVIKNCPNFSRITDTNNAR